MSKRHTRKKVRKNKTRCNKTYRQRGGGPTRKRPTPPPIWETATSVLVSKVREEEAAKKAETKRAARQKRLENYTKRRDEVVNPLFTEAISQVVPNKSSDEDADDGERMIARFPRVRAFPSGVNPDLSVTASASTSLSQILAIYKKLQECAIVSIVGHASLCTTYNDCISSKVKGRKSLTKMNTNQSVGVSGLASFTTPRNVYVITLPAGGEYSFFGYNNHVDMVNNQQTFRDILMLNDQKTDVIERDNPESKYPLLAGGRRIGPTSICPDLCLSFQDSNSYFQKRLGVANIGEITSIEDMESDAKKIIKPTDPGPYGNGDIFLSQILQLLSEKYPAGVIVILASCTGPYRGFSVEQLRAHNGYSSSKEMLSAISNHLFYAQQQIIAADIAYSSTNTTFSPEELTGNKMEFVIPKDYGSDGPVTDLHPVFLAGLIVETDGDIIENTAEDYGVSRDTFEQAKLLVQVCREAEIPTP